MKPRSYYETDNDFYQDIVNELLSEHRQFVLNVLDANGINWADMTEGELNEYILSLALEENPFFFELIPFTLRKN